MIASVLLMTFLVMVSPQSGSSPAPAATGTAVLRGRVVDKASGAPLHRAVVSLRHSRDGTAEQRFTDDRGRFEFTAVAAGQYELRASAGLYRTTHVSTAYPEPIETGRSRPLLTVKEGEERHEILIALPRALSIGGRVIDEAGRPLAQIAISVSSVRGAPDGFYGRPRMTDDLGMFRLYGLPPGRYVVCAGVGRGPGFEAQPQRRLQYVRTCYPAASDATDATEVVLTDADVEAIEIRMPRRPTFVITGTVVTAEGVPPENATVMLTRFEANGTSGTGTQLQPGGTFAITSVIPGTYEISARLGRNPHGFQQDDRDPRWGSVRVDVTTADVDGLVIVMKAAVSLKGRIVYEDPPQAPPDGPLRITTGATRGMFDRPGTAPATVADDGTFELKGLFGPVLVRTEGPAPRGYILKSVMYRGRDVLDIPTEFDGDPAHDVQVVLTSRTAELSGQVLDETGKTVASATIVRLPADPARWKGFQNFTAGGVTRSGTYRIGMLAAGEYLVAAIAPRELNGLTLPEDFDRLAAIAERITILENERRTADLRLMAVPPRRKE